jgi:hypothetical protein
MVTITHRLEQYFLKILTKNRSHFRQNLVSNKHMIIILKKCLSRIEWYYLQSRRLINFTPGI